MTDLWARFRAWLTSVDVWVETLKNDRLALFYASREAEVGHYARSDAELQLYAYTEVGRPTKALLQIALAYALSPISIFPEWIPILGWLDSHLLLPSQPYACEGEMQFVCKHPKCGQRLA